MKKKVLLPTDFSKNAWNAITYACDLYKDQECEFYIVNVYRASGYALESMTIPEPGDTIYEKAKQESDAGLTRIREMLNFRAANEKHTFIMLSQFNELIQALKDIVEKRDIDLIIMGTKGKTDSSDIFFGSNAIDAMEKIRNCPVLAIPADSRFSEMKEVVFPTNYKTHFKHRELECMTEIVKISNARIAILHIDKEDNLTREQENYKSLLEENLEELDYSFHTLHHNDVGEAIQMFVESRGSDFIAFINSKHFLFGSIFSKPLVKYLGLYSKVPILAMHTIKN